MPGVDYDPSASSADLSWIFMGFEVLTNSWPPSQIMIQGLPDKGVQQLRMPDGIYWRSLEAPFCDLRAQQARLTE